MTTVALTFDDGPDPVWTPRVLDALTAAGAPATFFAVAPRAAAHPAALAAVLAAGHAVELHCGAHVRHTDAGRAAVEADTEAALAVLREHGARPRRWRTPWGVQAPWTPAVAAGHGLELVGWSADTHDWRGDGADAMLAAIGPRLAPGGVVLMHDGLGPGGATDGLRGDRAPRAAAGRPAAGARSRARRAGRAGDGVPGVAAAPPSPRRSRASPPARRRSTPARPSRTPPSTRCATRARSRRRSPAPTAAARSASRRSGSSCAPCHAPTARSGASTTATSTRSTAWRRWRPSRCAPTSSPPSRPAGCDSGSGAPTPPTGRGCRRGCSTRPRAQVLHGVKTYCSGAGGVQRALVLARAPDGGGPPLLTYADLGAGVEIDRAWFRAAGMRASESHRVVFSGRACSRCWASPARSRASRGSGSTRSGPPRPGPASRTRPWTRRSACWPRGANPTTSRRWPPAGCAGTRRRSTPGWPTPAPSRRRTRAGRR